MRQIIIVLIGLCGLLAQAQNVLLEEGKSWLWKDYDPFMEETPAMYFTHTVVGDTIVNGEKAVLLRVDYLDSDQKSSYTVMKEENGKIMGLYYDEFVPLMDFNFNVGDEIGWCYHVDSIGYMEIEGITRKVLTIQNLPEATPEYWIEGIGATVGEIYIQVFESPIGHITELQECYLGDRCLFSRENFKLQTSVDEIFTNEVNADDVNETVFDLMGRPVANPQKGNVYIRSSKKIVW